jgi:hypothetical protein
MGTQRHQGKFFVLVIVMLTRDARGNIACNSDANEAGRVSFSLRAVRMASGAE